MRVNQNIAQGIKFLKLQDGNSFPTYEDRTSDDDYLWGTGYKTLTEHIKVFADRADNFDAEAKAILAQEELEANPLFGAF